MYQYIASFVSQYSDILDNTVQCVLADFTDEQNLFPKLYLLEILIVVEP